MSPGAASRFVVTAPTMATAGSGFSVSVTALDAFGNTATGYGGAVTLTSSDGQAVKVLTQPAFTNGTAVWTVALDTANTVRLTAASVGAAGVSPYVTISPGTVSQLAIDATNTATAGNWFEIRIFAEDAFGNWVIGFDGGCTLTSSDGQAVNLQTEPVLSYGNAAVIAWLDRTGTITLTAVSGTIGGKSGPIVVSPGPAEMLTVSAPADVTAVGGFSVTLTAEDGWGNTATSFDGPVTLSSSDGQAVQVLSRPGFTDGMAVWTVALDKVDTLSLTASSAGVLSGVSGDVTVSPGAASRFALYVPNSTIAGRPFWVTMIAEDAGGNQVMDYTGVCTLTSSDGQAVSLQSQPVFDYGGASVLATLDRADTVTLTASAGAAAGTSSGIAVSASNLAALAVSTPSTVSAGTSFTATVTAVDAFGNPVGGSEGGVTLHSTDGQTVDLASVPVFSDGTRR